MARRTGFTLIELLVVVTIIVVLLALLTPAMDRAIYAAQLAVCGGNLRGISTACVNYAMNHKRTYPSRGDYSWEAMQIVNPNITTAAVPFDMRREVEGYVAPNIFLDPLSAEISLSESDNFDNTVIFCNYNIYSGWGVTGNKFMKKVGERWSWQNPEDQARYSFRVLAADIDRGTMTGFKNTSHPDDEGLLQFVAYQNLENPDAFGGPGIPGGVAYRTTFSWWFGGGPRRGKIDNQYAMDDGSVVRFDRLKWNLNDGANDPRVVFTVDVSAEAFNGGGRRTQLPKAN
jgi:prepilin-type N-terminal cleavage/methylation domain-containing protein